jgi:hypothetical protein
VLAGVHQRLPASPPGKRPVNRRHFHEIRSRADDVKDVHG